MENKGIKIWLINQYAMPPELESRLRTIKFAHYLKQKGYDVTIFSASYMHNMNVNLIRDKSPYIEKVYNDLHFVHIRTIGYKTNGFKRWWSLIEFPFRFLRYYKRFGTPDIIIHTATVPWGNIISRVIKKLKAQYIVEILDLWPESFVAFGLVGEKNPLLKLAYKAEKWLYTKADNVVFSMEGGSQYIKDKKWDIESGGTIDMKKVHYINNGVDIDDFNRYKEKFKLEDEDLVKPNFKVVYLGSIRHANHLKSLIDAARLLIDFEDIKFLIYGDGDQRKELEEFCKKNSFTNVIFKEKWIDPQYVPYVLSNSSLNILNYLPNDVDKYGVSSSKLFQYMAAGKPVCSNLDMTNYCLITKYNLGVAKFFKTPEEYADAIMSIYNLNGTEYDAMCLRARSLAKEFDYKRLTDMLTNIFSV
jgi:glycosyltransferase involved in cell wall biosynthesis